MDVELIPQPKPRPGQNPVVGIGLAHTGVSRGMVLGKGVG